MTMPPFRPIRRRSRIRTALYALAILLTIGFLLNLRRGALSDDNALSDELYYDEASAAQRTTNDLSWRGDKAFVIASQKNDDVDWYFRYFPDWEKYVYIVDDPKAELTVKKNKGRESMVYLTYIIDNYDSLPNYMLFLHPKRFQWHNDDPDYDGLPVLRNFQLPYLEREGYVNLRCAWVLGCPEEIKPFEEDAMAKQQAKQQSHAGHYYQKAFKEIFGEDAEVPNKVAVSCCAQFALTREKVRGLAKSEYMRLREWLENTELTDDISGRVLEYSWHILFGKPPVHCPNASECYCNVFGLCDLECNEQGMCKDRYILPPFATLPEGWPYIGWDNSPRQRVFEIGV